MAQVKIIEMWKSLNQSNSPVKIEVHANEINERVSRSGTAGKIVEKGTDKLSLSTCLNDSSRAWNRLPALLKDCKSIYMLKRNTKKLFCLCLCNILSVGTILTMYVLCYYTHVCFYD